MAKYLKISKIELVNNIQTIKNIANNSSSKPQIIAVLKGNGYGLDMIKFAQVLFDNGIDMFAVSEISEAVKLRQSGFLSEILLLSSTSIDEDINLIIENDITATCGSFASLIKLNKLASEQSKMIKVHIKVETGFGRYGFYKKEVIDLISLIKSLNNIEVQGIFSHLSASFADKSNITMAQNEIFKDILSIFIENGIMFKYIHMANSLGFLKYSSLHYNAVRVGSAFLGRLPIKNLYGLKKIGILESDIVEIKNLPKGHNVGYANIYRLKKDTKIAIVPAGYSDGVNVVTDRYSPRLIDLIRNIYNDIKNFVKSKSTYVTINNQKCKILGRIGMMNIIVDISNVKAENGDKVYIEVNPIYVDSKIERIYE